MNGTAANREGGFAGTRLRGQHRKLRRNSVASVENVHRVDDGGAGELGVHPHIDQPVLNGLEARDRLAELDPVPCVADGEFDRLCRNAGKLGGQRQSRMEHRLVE
jgi:hypothetical protein